MHQERPDDAVARLATATDGVFTRATALAAGFTRRAVEHRVTSGQWVRVHPGVYRHRFTPDSTRLRQRAAVLWAGTSMLAFESAASLWGFDDIAAGQPHLWVPRAKSVRVEGLVAHRTTMFAALAMRRRFGLPVTSAEQTVIDLAGTLDEEVHEAAFEFARRAGYLSVPSTQRQFERWATRGCAGADRMRSLLRALDGRPPCESRLEVKFARLLRASDLPEPARQVKITVDGVVYRADFAWGSVLAECVGRRWHTDSNDFERGNARLVELASHGYTVLPFTWQQLTTSPNWVLGRLSSALGGARSAA